MPDAYSWSQANVTAHYFLKQCLSSAGRWLCGSSPQPTSQRKSSLQELKIASSFYCEIKQFSHTHTYVNAASVQQFWSLKTHIYSCQNVIAIVHKIILLLSGAFPKVPHTEDSVGLSCPLQKLQSQCCKEVSRAMHIPEVVALGILPHNTVSE